MVHFYGTAVNYIILTVGIITAHIHSCLHRFSLLNRIASCCGQREPSTYHIDITEWRGDGAFLHTSPRAKTFFLARNAEVSTQLNNVFRPPHDVSNQRANSYSSGLLLTTVKVSTFKRLFLADMEYTASPPHIPA